MAERAASPKIVNDDVVFFNRFLMNSKIIVMKGRAFQRLAAGGPVLLWLIGLRKNKFCGQKIGTQRGMQWMRI